MTAAAVPHPGLNFPPLWYVRRPRLDAPLDDLTRGDARIIGLWGAAGSGKTTLMNEWARILADTHGPVGWVSARDLAETEATPARWAAGGPDETGRRFVFIDDLHLVPRPMRAGLLDRLLATSADPVRFVVSGRYQPTPGAAQLEAAGTLIGYGDGTLAFTLAETFQLAARHGLSMSAEDGLILWRRTAGWATGLALAMAWLRGVGDPGALRQFDGDNRAVADYLSEEIIDQLPSGDRAVLQSAAVSDVVPLDLAVEVSGRRDAGAVLQRLARQNSLIMTDPDDRGIDGFRYHPVLRSFLEAEGRRRDSSAASGRHLTASRWFAQRGEGQNALEQAILTNRWTTILSMLDRFGLELVLRGSTSLVARALEQAPERPDAAADPAVPALGLLLDVPYLPDHRRARALLADLDRCLAAVDTPDRRWAAVRTALHVFEPADRTELGNRVEAVERDTLADGAAGSFPGDLAVELLLATARAWALAQLGRPGPAADDLIDVARIATSAGFGWLFLLASDLAATYSARQGDWVRVSMLERDMAGATAGAEHPVDLATARAALYAMVHRYERCRSLDTALLDEIVTTHRADPGLTVPAKVLAILATLDDGTHPRQGLDRLMRLMRESGAEQPRAMSLCCLRLFELSVILDGRAEAQFVVHLVESVLGEESLEALLVRFLLNPPTRAGQPAEDKLVAAAIDEGTCWRGSTLVSAWIALAHTAEAAGRHVEADGRLMRALRLAEQFGVERAFLAFGGRGAALIRGRMGRLGDLDDFARHVQRCAERVLPAEHGNGLHALTQRERELLRELPFHQSVADIARNRNVSSNTVKTHLRNIYQKLEATNRAQAVVIARERGLL